MTVMKIGNSEECPQTNMRGDECADCMSLLSERDFAQDWADELAQRIADILGVEIGEHSNLNNPWQEACDYADGFLAKQAKFANSRETR